jgi:CMP-N-acetylneuraminate monooxygenase
LDFIRNYFENSNFKDNLVLFISLVNDNFMNSKLDFKIDFTGERPLFSLIKNFSGKIRNMKKVKQLYLKCRLESFLNTIYNKEPWEDLSIGFQCKIMRSPNEYNYKFWHYFSNTYITSKNIRFTTECNSCDKLNQYIDNQVHQKN